VALQPRMRIPLWAAVAIPAAAYVMRSISRGSWGLDMPLDAIVLAGLVFAVVVAARYGTAAQRRRGDLDREADGGDGSEGHSGQGEQV